MTHRQDRFRPARFGIVSLYQYAEQVFVPEQGRLALRGRNTSGKSKALELLVPFVLDGDITPRKLDPFGSRTKTMRWNLIECTDDYERDSKRIGYCWAEFTRMVDGAEQVITCGVGMEAARGSDGLKDRWYFVTPQRVGSELELCRTIREQRQPLVKADLTAAVKDGGGHVYDTQADYKEALRAELLQFPTRELYEQHLEVVRQLRKPKLSDKLDIATLAGLLSSTLPAVDESLMRKLGDSLERLETMQADADALGAARAMVASLAEGAYRTYARGLVFTRGGALREADLAFERAGGRQRRAEAGLTGAQQERGEAEAAVDDLGTEQRRTAAARETLLASEEYQQVAALTERRREHGEADARVTDRRAELEDARGRLTDAAETATKSHERVQAEQAALDQVAAALRDVAAAAGLALEAVSFEDLERLSNASTTRQAELEHARKLQRALAAARAGVEALRDPIAAAEIAVDGATDEHQAAADELERRRQQAELQLSDWAERLVELALSDGDVDAFGVLLLEGEDGTAALAALAQPRRQELADALAQLNAEHGSVEGQRGAVLDRLADLAAQTDPAPAPRSPRPARREGRAGAPLWKVCDFSPTLAAADRGALEAALEELGLLDAWLSPDGSLHDGDSVLVATAATPTTDAGGTLAELLTPAVGETGLDPVLVAAVLASVPLTGPLSVRPGGFQAGPLHGRHAKPAAQYVGATARTAHRAALIEAAERERDALDSQLAILASRTDQLRSAQARLDAEQDALPSSAGVREALATLAVRAAGLTQAETARAGLWGQREVAEVTAAQAQAAMSEHAGRAGLPERDEELDRVDRALRALDAQASLARGALQNHQHAEELHAGAERHRDEQERLVQLADERLRTAAAELAEARGRLDAAERAHGATARELEAELSALSARLASLREELELAYDRKEQAAVALSEAEQELASAADALQQADDRRASALAAVRALGAHDLFSAAFGADGAPEDERSAASWSLTTALERVRALPAPDQQIDLENRQRRVTEAVSELAKRLVAFEMDARLELSDGLALVEVSRHGSIMTPPALLSELDEDLERRELTLSEERRRVFGDALLSEIAEELRAKVSEVQTSVRARNATLRDCRTGARRFVQLRRVKALETEAERDVLALLEGGSIALLEEQRRRQVFEFFQTRITLARAELSDAPGERSAADYLSQAFDYRRWWRFELELHEPNGSTRLLTRAAQERGSGGEQSVLMHMPLFATAASLYDMVPTSPRIVALDEAMDGIDDPTREQMFAVLVSLDLDLFITSFDINPCVATVPRIGFYELHRDQAEWGVYAQHFVWDGKQTVEIDDA